MIKITTINQEITTKLFNGDEYIITNELIAELELKYPDIEVYKKLLSMKKWLSNKPRARPMQPTILRFMNEWITKKEEDYSSSVPSTPNKKPKEIKDIDAYPSLECPICEKMTKPERLNKDGTIAYSCGAVSKHSDFSKHTWKITPDGEQVD
jgi:hypothetical protein